MKQNDIKGVKLSEQQKEDLKHNHYVRYLLDKSYKVDINEMMDYIKENSYYYKIFMTDTSFNFFYNCYRSNSIVCNNLFDNYTYTYGSLIDNIKSLVDDYVKYNNIPGDITLICDCNFQGSSFGPMIINIFNCFYDCCIKKGVEIKKKLDLEEIFLKKLKILFLTNVGELPTMYENKSIIFDKKLTSYHQKKIFSL